MGAGWTSGEEIKMGIDNSIIGSETYVNEGEIGIKNECMRVLDKFKGVRFEGFKSGR